MAADTLYRSHDFAFHDSHHWEDWVELCCIADLDGEADVTSIADRLREERDTRKEEDSQDDTGSDESAENTEWALESEKHNLRVKEWFIALSNRAQMLDGDYPFELNAENSKLKLRTTLTDVHRLYVAFLMMANLHYFDSSESDLTASFEEIGVAVFQWLLPSHADVHRFGKGPHNKGIFKGQIWKKIELLAQRLACNIRCKKEDFSPSDTGESGLDLVGWVPWKDAAPGRLILLGQCACGRNWVNKQHEASGSKWGNILDFPTRPLTVVLIPFFLRTSSGAWHGRPDFSDHLIIDRLRLLRTLRATASELSKLPALKHVTKCLATKEGAY